VNLDDFIGTEEEIMEMVREMRGKIKKMVEKFIVNSRKGFVKDMKWSYIRVERRERIGTITRGEKKDL
jgi:hypothetical protein